MRRGRVHKRLLTQLQLAVESDLTALKVIQGSITFSGILHVTWLMSVYNAIVLPRALRLCDSSSIVSRESSRAYTFLSIYAEAPAASSASIRASLVPPPQLQVARHPTVELNALHIVAARGPRTRRRLQNEWLLLPPL